MWRWLLVAVLYVPSQPLVAPAVRAEEPPAALGTISGTVIDKTTGDPIIEAGVEVIGLKKTVRTDLDGRFSVKIPPGTYEVRVFAPLFQGTRLQNVAVKPNDVTKLGVALSAAVAGVEVVEVVAQARKAAEASQLLKRQKADAIQDNIAAETIQKSSDSDAGEVATRLTAVTVEEGKFIFVRGLGERYSSALLNGSRLSSPDPEKRVVPLDLFPSEFIDSMSISKTFTADLPGDFSGGLLDIDLREFPDKLTAGLGVSTAVNTGTSFKKFLSYKGRGNALPDLFPEDNVQIPTGPEQHLLASSLPNVWTPNSFTAPPDGTVSASLGNSWGPFGLSVAGTYSNEYLTIRDQKQRTIVQAGGTQTSEPVATDDFRYDSGTQSNRLGAILTSGYNLTPDHKLSLRALYDDNEEKQALFGQGFDSQGRASEQTQLQRVTERLSFGQLAGEHHLPWFQLDWRSAFSHTTQDIPDSRTLSYVGSDFNHLAYSNDAAGGDRAFSQLSENLTDSALDITVPFRTGLPGTDVWSGLPAKVKFGAAYAYRDRDYSLRIFKYTSLDGTRNSLPPEILLDPVNVPTDVQFSEISQKYDLFKATHEIAAAYLNLELPLIRDQLRLIAGVREEYSLIRMDTADQQGNPVHIPIKDVNPLPAVSLIYSPRRDMNVRAAYSWTVSRPEFRELTPAIFPTNRGFRPVVGNENLVQAEIKSIDLRWEWFFSPTELVSLGGFHKTLSGAIEQSLISVGSQFVQTWVNTDEGALNGFEFELRKNFGFFGPWWDYLTFNLNAAYVHSNVTFPDRGTVNGQSYDFGSLLTTLDKPLSGQAPFVINAALEYTHPRWGTARLLYNTFGQSLDAAGFVPLPDQFQLRRDALDAVVIVPMKELLGVPISLKFSVENILNDQFISDQGGVAQQSFIRGTKFGLGLSYTY